MDGNTEAVAEDGRDSGNAACGRRPLTMARQPLFLGMRSWIKARGQVAVMQRGEKMRFQGGREPHVERNDKA
jgi:hypothetical protein